ncbi:MAG: DUF2225 domain-containing protein [Pseudothermotoga sp.]|uniref:DUF2225 domain-containing protein n=1 Tax=Pseudothermotoga sp. TaxID=2033661 RepID=UPI000ACCA5F9|nr:DUF2225 domain-containing protein [Pseudothermotoga sp.]HBT39872.1 DUF2225 domain-containing protein [Pseudothermotoga sp.]HCO97479.1 DUF2225 domain-containing protein [Pseudothermotoga sp.]
MRTFWNKNYVCPVCKNQFEAVRIFSDAIKIKNRESDLKPVYDGVNVLMFQLVSCPKCLYTSFEDDFGDLTSLQAETIARMHEKLKQIEIDLSENKKIRDAAVQYNIAAAMYVARKKSFRAAESLLKLAWLYRDAGAPDEEKRALERAKELFLKSYMEEDLSEDRQIAVLFYLGEIEKRLGNRKESVRWFSELFRRFSKSGSIYVKQARQEWQEVSLEK